MVYEIIATKNGNERLLYAEAFLDDSLINLPLPSPDLYLTDSFDAGTEFIRISSIPSNSIAYWLQGDSYEPIAIRSLLSNPIVVLPFLSHVLQFIDLTDAGIPTGSLSDEISLILAGVTDLQDNLL